MALAAACPTAMPCILKALSAIAPSDASCCVASVRQESRTTRERRSFGCGRDEVREHVVRRRCDGGVDRRLRTRTLLEQILAMLLRPDRVDRVVDGALHHAHVDLECGRRTAVRPRERDERGRRDLVPVSHLTGVGSRRWCGRDADGAERAQERTDCHRDERDGSSTRHRSPPRGPRLGGSRHGVLLRSPERWRDRRDSVPTHMASETNQNASNLRVTPVAHAGTGILCRSGRRV